jgi:hypothetical protein
MKSGIKRRSLSFLGQGVGVFVSSLVGFGCEGESQRYPAANLAAQVGDETPKPQEKPASKSEDPSKSEKAGDAKKVEMGKNVWLEVQGNRRRVIVKAEVCLREGMLEHLMCRKRTKEHEAILAADVDARHIHAALLAAKATPGKTVKYKEDGTIIPPTGTKIKITLSYKDKDKQVTVPGRDWVRDLKTKKSLEHDWVFAGSEFQINPLEKDKPPLYAANAGDVICVSNFEGAMLDLPINSSKNNAELEFEAFTERIPPLGTPVTVILEPVLETKKK